jgi:hypothetical protein
MITVNRIEHIPDEDTSRKSFSSSKGTYYQVNVWWESTTCEDPVKRKFLNDISYTIEHSYKEFSWLDAQLRSRLGNAQLKSNMNYCCCCYCCCYCCLLLLLLLLLLLSVVATVVATVVVTEN